MNIYDKELSNTKNHEKINTIVYDAVIRRMKDKKNNFNHYQTINTSVQLAYDIVDNRNLYKFKTKFEKMIFKMNYIFPNDEEFMKNVNNYDEDKILKKLLDDLEKAIKIEDDKRRSLIENSIIKCFVSKNNEQLKSIINNFKNYYLVSDIELIINRLAQIKYLNNDVYYNNKNNQKIKTRKNSFC